MAELIIKTIDGTVGLPERWLAFVARELRGGAPTRHYQTTGVGLAAVADALEQWSRGARDFVDEHEWSRLRDFDETADVES